MPEQLNKFKAKPNSIALTFDDGPIPESLDNPGTPGVLRYLSDNNIKATFFVNGIKAEQYPEIIESIVKNGHSIGSHCYEHRQIDLFDYDQTRFQIVKNHDVIKAITGNDMTLFRGPGGSTNNHMWSILNELNYKYVCYWTSYSGDDGDMDGKNIVKRIYHDLFPSPTGFGGSWILHHDGVRPIGTIESLKIYVPFCKAIGHEFEVIS